MKKIFVVIGFSFLIFGCSKKITSGDDFFDGRLSSEKIYSIVKNNAQLAEINKAKLKKEDTPDNRMALAQNYYDLQDYDSALYYLQPLLKKDKEDDRALLLQAKIFDFLNKDDEALKSAQKASILNPKNAQAFNMIGIIYAKKKDLQQAQANFFKAKSLFLADEIINNNLGMLNLLKGNYQEAINYLLPLYNRGFKDPKIFSNLIVALIKADRRKDALDILVANKISSKKLIKTIDNLKFDDLGKK